MKCTIPEMSWHNRDPVLSVDIQPKSSTNTDQNEFTRLASGGADTHVIIWYIVNSENGTMQLELAADLKRHQRSVNAVRWSPCGTYLATGDDESIIFIWRMKNDSEPANICDDEDEQDKETWVIYKTLRGHLDDVYDLSWSPDSMSLISGSVDNTACVWDIKKSKPKAILNDHKGFVQGVAWDPKEQYLVTLSTDRYLRIFDAKTHKTIRRLNKSTYPVDDSSPLYNRQVRLFHDDTLLSFFRRLTFTPDGELIIVPAGVSDVITSSAGTDGSVGKAVDIKPMHATYIFSRHSTKRPAIVIPSLDEFTVAVRCCPQLFQLLPIAGKPAIDLPYRMIFAIATKSSVRLYDTQQQMPFAIISNIHYARLTDLTWSSDGTALIASSVDGFCTLIIFEKGELGKIYEKPVEEPMDVTPSKDESKENITKDENINVVLNKPTQIATRKQPRDGTSVNPENDSKQNVAVALDIPETIIATTESFESPEYKGTPATPIAIRREPRTNPSTPTAGQTAKVTEETNSGAGVSAKKATPIAVRRQPRNILASATTAIINQTNVEHEEALDAWPIPIDSNIKPITSMDATKKNALSASDVEKTEDMRLIYDGDSESIVTKTIGTSSVLEANSGPSDNESPAPKDASASKTPRRVQLRTISTPKSKKKLL